MKRRLWQWIHNCLVHPIEGMCQLVMGRSPAWVNRWHEATACRAFATGTEAAVDDVVRQITPRPHIEFVVQFQGTKVGKLFTLGSSALHCWGRTDDGRTIDLYIQPFEREVDVSRFVIQLEPRRTVATVARTG